MFAPSDLSPPGPASRPQSAEADCSIKTAAVSSGVSAKMIRYYESIGLLRPVARSASNYRRYGAADIAALRFIARARYLGFGMEEIARLLALWQEPDRSSADVKALALAHAAELGQRIAALQAMKATIEHLAEQCLGDAQPACPILDDLAGAAEQPPGINRVRRHV